LRHNKKVLPGGLPDSIEEVLRDFFAGRAEVLLSYMFGSYLAKSTRRFHDIDIAVLVLPERVEALHQSTPYGYEAYMISELAHLLKYSSIDLVVLNNGSPLLQRQVITKGKLLFGRSESERIRFETFALQRYADTAHLRKIKRLYMKKRIKKGLDAYV